jgi:hypothetical protein
MKDPVVGWALVVSVEGVLPTANPVMFRGELVVSADGVSKTTVDHKERYWRKGRESITVIWPSAGDTVPVIVDRADPTRLRLDWDQIRETAKAAQSEARHDAEQRLLREAYGRPTAERDTDSGPAKLDHAQILAAAELLATGQRMTGIVREFAPTGKTAGETDPAAANPNDPLYAFTLELPLEGATPVIAAFVTRVPAGKTDQLGLGKRMNVAVNPGNPTREVAIDWDTSPTSP